MFGTIFASVAVCFIGTVTQACDRHGVKCPEYTVLKQHDGYETRQYPSLVWVSTSAPADNRNEVSRDLIKRLYKYLGGENNKGVNVEMMVPVRTAKLPYGKSFNYTMSVLIDVDQQNDEALPKPTSELLTLDREPSITYYARSFSGMARHEATWDSEAGILKSLLAADDQVPSSSQPAADVSFYYRCAYDSPWREGDRLNEVWYRKSR